MGENEKKKEAKYHQFWNSGIAGLVVLPPLVSTFSV
jgi:hypothetical protein